MITRVNYNRGRRFLNPLEIEAQYITEDRATNPDLLLWIDFTDKTSLKGITSGGMNTVSNGEGIMVAQNKSFYPDGANAGMVSAGDKALSSAVFQTDASKCPTYIEPANGVPYALFSGNDFMHAMGSLGRASATDFSTSDLDVNKFTAYFVCQRLDPSTPGRQDVFFLTTNDFSVNNVPEVFASFYFADLDGGGGTSYDGTFEMYDASLAAGSRYRYVKYDEPDDGQFHYHMFNAYENYNNSSNYGSLQADGVFHQFTESYDYNKISSPGFGMLDGSSGTLSNTFDFSGTSTYHSSITIGGQPQFGTSIAPKGTFVGKIYEILLFKSEHAGPNFVDVLFFSKTFKRRWSNMLYYFQRKYQYINPKI